MEALKLTLPRRPPPSTAAVILHVHGALDAEYSLLTGLCSRRAAELSKNILLWPWAVFNANYHEIRSKTGMDAYFFVRFLRMMVRVLVPIWLVSWAILLPATGVRSDPGTLTGLDRFTFGNVPPNQQSRYAAHIILAWFFTSECYSRCSALFKLI